MYNIWRQQPGLFPADKKETPYLTATPRSNPLRGKLARAMLSQDLKLKATGNGGTMVVSWCDKLASVPSVGFGLEWDFVSSEAVLAALAPLLRDMVKDDKVLFNVLRQEFNLTINSNEGYIYGVEPSKIFVGFQHMVRPKAVSGSYPIMETLSQRTPYTKLLPKISDKLVDVTLMLPGTKNRRVTRVGVVTTTTVSENDAPPGIARFVEHVGRPWGGALEAYSIQITSKVREGREWTDKCTHIVTKPEGDDELINVMLDWQRTLKVAYNINKGELRTLANRAERDALSYFEDVAEGGRFDAEFDGSEVG